MESKMYLTQTEADAKGLPSVQEQIDRYNQAIRDLKGKGPITDRAKRYRAQQDVQGPRKQSVPF